MVHVNRKTQLENGRLSSNFLLEEECRIRGTKQGNADLVLRSSLSDLWLTP